MSCLCVVLHVHVWCSCLLLSCPVTEIGSETETAIGRGILAAAGEEEAGIEADHEADHDRGRGVASEGGTIDHTHHRIIIVGGKITSITSVLH